MNDGTEPVLELLVLAHPVAMKASDMVKNLNRLQEKSPSRSTVYRAVDELEDRGYIEKTENDLFLITPKGVEYLDGEITNLDIVGDLE